MNINTTFAYSVNPNRKCLRANSNELAHVPVVDAQGVIILDYHQAVTFSKT